ncbi:hypothetical protein ABZP36_015865 [Zizania latifolia]
MDGADAMAPPGWSLLRGYYFSPATLFLLLNVVIGTIALTSRSHRRRRHHHDEHYKVEQQNCLDQYAPPPPAPLARTSSVMERLRSLGLYRFRSGDFPPEYNLSAANAIYDESEKQQAQYTRSRSEPAPAPREPPVELKRKKEKASHSPPNVVKAVKKSSSEVKKLERAPAQAKQVQRAPPRAQARTVQAAARKEIPAELEAAAGSSVDARADDFINKFRQQLQLQRLNSLLNYNEMLNRGT